MDVLILLYIVTVAFTGVTGQQVEVKPKVYSYPGQTVNLSCVFTDTTGITLAVVTWSYQPKDRERTNIAVFAPSTDPNYPLSPVKGRVSFSPSPPDPASPSIQISEVKKTDEGNYICSIAAIPGGNKEGTTNLEMLEPVSNVTLTPSSTDLVEFSGSVLLSCSSSGSFPSFLWLNSSSEVTASDRVHITDGGSTLTIVSVTRYDQGPYRCQAFNTINNDTSDPELLSISFGPENTRLTKPPSQDYEEGSNISLNCSADSRPTAQFTWFLNKELMADTGSELRLVNIKESQSGNYSCQAFNKKTMRNETSQPSVISVLKRIVDASVTPSTNQTEKGNSVNLTCEAAGSVFTRKWMKNGADLTENDNMRFYNESRVLSFLSLNKTDSGEYSCILSNPLSNVTVQYNMTVYFGPENVQIQGPNRISVNETLTLTCSAESTPPPTFTWKLNETETHTLPVLEKHITDVSDGGNYTCEVMNSITGRKSSAVHELTVTLFPDPTTTPPTPTPPPPTPPPPPLPPPIPIWIIVIGCLAAVIIVALVSGGLYIKREELKKICNRDTSTRIGGGGQNNTAFSGDQELNYADVRFVRNRDGGMVDLGAENRNRDGGTVDLGAENDTSEYAQVNVGNRPAAASSPPTYDAHMQKRTAPVHPSGANGEQQYAQVRK